jgi:dUTP pyrophosphatase
MAVIYFAHPIDRADERTKEAIHVVRQVAAGYDSVAMFDPTNAWTVTKPLDGHVQTINEDAIRKSHSMLALLPSHVTSRGVPGELATALAAGMPVTLLTDSEFGVNSVYEKFLMEHPLVDHHCYGDQHIVVPRVEAAFQSAKHRAEAQQDVSRFAAPLPLRRAARFTSDTAGQLSRAHSGDAGFDLAYSGTEPLHIGLMATVMVPTGVRIQLPDGYYAVITGRSSTFSKRNLLVPLSIIDHGFRGELFAVCRNLGYMQQIVMPGERIAQLIPMRLEAPMLEWHQVEQLDDSDRGERGFGSTGR